MSSKISIAVCAVAMCLAFTVPAHAHPGGHDRIMTLNEQIAHEPKNAYLLIKRAQEVIQEEQKFVPAKADLDKARSLGATENNSHEYNFVMGLYHQFQAQHPAAIEFFKRCVSLDTHHLQCYRAWAESALAMKEPKTAIGVLTHFIKSSESAQTDDYFHLAQLLEQDQKPDQALKYLDQAQARFGALPHFEKYAIRLETNQQNFTKALERHLALKPFFGKTPQWQYEHGVLFEKLGDQTQAKQFYEQALATIESKNKKKNKASATLQQEIEAKLASLKN